MATLPKGQGVFLPPFKAWLASNIPAVYDNTMTYYEELVALIKYLQDIVVPAVNDNASAVTIISNAVEQLQSYVENYFANLDVQEEINNKLDQMAEDGTLQEIIATYLDANVTWTYLNVAEMKAATNLTNGSRARTLGYYAPNDGGDGLYYITNEENLVEDNGSIIELTNGCFAKLVTEDNNVNVKQFGAKGDGTTDDSEAVRNALKFNGNEQSSVSFVKGETYLVDGNFYIYSNTIVDLNKCEIKVVDGTPSSDAYNRVQFMNNLESMTVEGYGAIENFHVKNGTLNGNIGGISFLLFHGLNCSFTDIDFQNCFVSTHIFDLLGCKNIEIKSCKFVGNLLSVSSNNFREVIQPDYATYGAGPYWGNDPSFAFDSIPTDGLLVDSCIFKKNTSDLYYLNGVGTHATNTGVHTNIVVRNCEFYDCQYSNIRLPKSSNVTIEGNTFYNIRSDRNADNFAINITNEGDLGVTALHDITIRNNKFISTGNTTDQIFIRVAGRTNNATENVIIEGNTYSGKAVSNAAYTGSDFMQANDINGLRITNNSITRAKAILFKGTTPIEILVFNYNI